MKIGERFGMIRFGSRTDLRMPPGSETRVRIGDRVRGGETIVGIVPEVMETVAVIRPGQGGEGPRVARARARPDGLLGA